MDLNVRAFRTVQEAIREDSPAIKAKKAAAKKGGHTWWPVACRIN